MNRRLATTFNESIFSGGLRLEDMSLRFGTRSIAMRVFSEVTTSGDGPRAVYMSSFCVTRIEDQLSLLNGKSYDDKLGAVDTSSWFGARGSNTLQFSMATSLIDVSRAVDVSFRCGTKAVKA